MTDLRVSLSRIQQTIRSHRSSLLVQQRIFAIDPQPRLEQSIAGLEKEIDRLELLVRNYHANGERRVNG